MSEHVSNHNNVSRRDFLTALGLGSGAMLLLGGCGSKTLDLVDRPYKGPYWALAVDYAKCAGCRTCETACAAHNNPLKHNGKTVPGLGNPRLANIRVHSFNPDVDVPVSCAMCSDEPCIAACPISPDAKGRKALYRDTRLGVIRNDAQRCIGCGSCAEACADGRTAILHLDELTRRPAGMCTLCDGEPQCVISCPYEALSIVEIKPGQIYKGLPAHQVAGELAQQWYGLELQGV